MKTEFVAESSSMAIRFHEKSIFSTLLGFIPHWGSKNYNEYISQKFILDCFAILDNIRLKCGCVDDSVMNGVREPTLFSFVSEKLPGYKVFSEPE